MVKAFRFHLDPVLRLRQMKEDEAQREFLQVKGLFDQRRNALDRLFDTRKRAREEMGSKADGSVDVKELLRYQRYLNGLRYQIATAQSEMGRLEKELHARRTIYQAARQEREILEKLCERRREAWAEELRRAEQKETDEIGTQLSVREGELR